MREHLISGNGKKRVRGFSMVELLIVMVIIGILTAIAYPAYREHLFKTRRSDAMSALTQMQMILERCYSQNFSYAAACGAIPALPQNSQQNFYSIDVANLGATTYTITATPSGNQAQDIKCASMTVNQANVKSAVDSGGAAAPLCWNP